MIRLVPALLVVLWSATGIATSGAGFTRESANPANSVATLLVRPPASVAASSAAAGAVTISWSATPTTIDAGHTLTYVVSRGPLGGPYARIGSTSASLLTYSDTPATDGTYSYVVQAQVTSIGGFQSVTSNTAAALSDRVPPTVAITCGGMACGGGWYNAAVSVTVSGTDTGIGMGWVVYQLDAGATNAVSGASTSFTVSGDSAGHGVAYSARDAAGNASATATQTIRIDATAPTAATSLAATPGTKGTPATITLSWTASSDTLSGVRGYEIRWTDAVTSCPPQSTTSYPNSATVGSATSATVPPTGALTNGSKYCAYVTTIDNAGNRSIPSVVVGPTPAK